MNQKNQHIVVGLGEALWDCFADSRRPGGAPTNVAYHAGQLGHQAVVCSRVGEDAMGRELVEHLRTSGLETRYIQTDAHRPTGYVTVDTTESHRPEYVIHENVAWDALEFGEDLADLMRRADAVCFGTLAQRSARSRETIHQALAAAGDALIVYDVNLRQKYYDRAWVEASLRAAHYVKLNQDEIDVLSEVLETGKPEAETFAAAVRQRYDVQTVCVTRAEKGCLLLDREEAVAVPGVKIEVVDSVGAGDAFTAALISARLRGWDWRATGAFANSVGGLVASRAGAMPDVKDEFARLIAEAEPGDGSGRR